MRKTGCLYLLLLTFVSTDIFAFGPTGHRITGAIAEQYLTNKSQRAIEAIIGQESLAEASTWADEMRQNPADFWQKQASYYHYVTVPEGKTYAEVGAPPQGDAVTALKTFRQTLKDKRASKEDKALALRFTVHIIADLHQPLHAGNGKDRGGNEFSVVFFGQRSNLHRVWDSGLINREDLSFSEWSSWLLKDIGKTQLEEWRSIDPETWIAESVGIRDKIYPAKPTISWGYQYQNLPVVKLRLQQAGVRLAQYLNDVFK